MLFSELCSSKKKTYHGFHKKKEKLSSKKSFQRYDE